MTVPATPSGLLRLEVFSSECGLHPDLVRRFVTLGLVEPAEQSGPDFWFAAAQVRRVARMERLRSDLSLNYSALGLVLDLLDRIEQLERAPRGSASYPLET
jgi:chaperone modulatory protein CbpM